MDENRKYKDKTILEELEKVISKRKNEEEIEVNIKIKDEGAVIEVVTGLKSEKKCKCECCEENEVKKSTEDFLTFLEKVLARG